MVKHRASIVTLPNHRKSILPLPGARDIQALGLWAWVLTVGNGFGGCQGRSLKLGSGYCFGLEFSKLGLRLGL